MELFQEFLIIFRHESYSYDSSNCFYKPGSYGHGLGHCFYGHKPYGYGSSYFNFFV